MPNPYDAPRSNQDRPPLRASFSVGDRERHTVEIYLGDLGEEVYAVDDEEVLRLKSYSLRSVREFEVGVDEVHSIRVVFDVIPSWRILIEPTWTAEVYVDDKLVIEDMYAERRLRLAKIHRILNWLLVIILTASVMGFAWLAFLVLSTYR